MAGLFSVTGPIKRRVPGNLRLPGSYYEKVYKKKIMWFAVFGAFLYKYSIFRIHEETVFRRLKVFE